jgi:hypothetical protein
MNDILNWIFGIVGVAGFLLAFALAWIEWHRYRLPLQMVLKEIDYYGSKEGNHLVVLWLAFVNPASAGKTVFRVQCGAPNSEDVSKCPTQYDRGHDTVIFRLPDSENAHEIAKNELLWPPLDISPNQSQIKAIPLFLKTTDNSSQHPQVHLRLIAFDVLGNNLASVDQTIELKTHQIF